MPLSSTVEPEIPSPKKSTPFPKKRSLLFSTPTSSTQMAIAITPKKVSRKARKARTKSQKRN